MTESLTTCSTHSHWATLSLGNSKFCKARIFILAHHQFDHKKSFVKLNEKVGKYWLENAGLTAVLGRWRPRTQLVQVYNFPQTAAAEPAGQTQNKHWLFHCLSLFATSLGNSWRLAEKGSLSKICKLFQHPQGRTNPQLQPEKPWGSKLQILHGFPSFPASHWERHTR